MHDFLRALFMSLLQWATSVLPKRGEGVDAHVHPHVLRRAGSRIREWMHAHGSGERVKPDQDGTGRSGPGVRQDG